MRILCQLLGGGVFYGNLYSSSDLYGDLLHGDGLFGAFLGAFLAAFLVFLAAFLAFPAAFLAFPVVFPAAASRRF